MEEQNHWRAFEAIAITTHSISAYGGVRMGVEVLNQLANQFGSDSVPMHAQHKMTDSIRTRGVSAAVRERDDGYHELVLTGEIHASDWDRVKHMSGMSVTVFEPLDGDDPLDEIKLAADAAWFRDEDITAAGAIMGRGAGTSTARAYQFALIPDPQVFVEVLLVTLQALGPNLAASALWDGLKHLLLHRRVPAGADKSARTIINVTVRELGGWTAVVETNDPDVATKALNRLTDAAQEAQADFTARGAAPTVSWDESVGEWRVIASKHTGTQEGESATDRPVA